MIQVVTRSNLGTDFDVAGTVTPGKVSVVRATLTTPGLVDLQSIYNPAQPVSLPVGSSAEGTTLGANTPAAATCTLLTVTGVTTLQGTLIAPNKLSLQSAALTLNGNVHNSAGTDYSVAVNASASTSASFDLNRNNSARGGLRLTNDDKVQLGSLIGTSTELLTSGAVRLSIDPTGTSTFTGPVVLQHTTQGVAPALSDNSTNLVTSAWVKAQGYHASAGLTTFADLTVTSDAILGTSASDSLVVSASALFESPVNFLNTTTILAPPLIDNSSRAVTSAWVKAQGYSGSGTSQAVVGNEFDLAGTVRLFHTTLTADTAFTVSNVPPAGTVCFFLLELTNGGAHTLSGSWWSSIRWQGGLPPTLTSAGVDFLGFLTYDNGVTWTGFRLLGDVS